MVHGQPARGDRGRDHRRRTRGLRRGHPRRRSRQERRPHRRAGSPGRCLPDRRMHPIQGAHQRRGAGGKRPRRAEDGAHVQRPLHGSGGVAPLERQRRGDPHQGDRRPAEAARRGRSLRGRARFLDNRTLEVERRRIRARSASGIASSPPDRTSTGCRRARRSRSGPRRRRCASPRSRRGCSSSAAATSALRWGWSMPGWARR